MEGQKQHVLQDKYETAIYFLQLHKEKLNMDQMKKLKGLLLYIIQHVTSHLMIEIHCDESIDLNMQLAQKLLFNGYNLFEPEYSKQFPTLQIDILIPQIFGSPSQVSTNKDISLIIYNELSDLLQEKLKERKSNSAFPDFKLLQINEILEDIKDIQMDYSMISSNFYEETEELNEEIRLFQFKGSGLGGTFDHMHNGHKILLSMALLLASDKVLIGVTGDALLKKKVYAEYLETYEERSQRVIQFCNLFNPKVKIETFVLQDPVGLAGTDEEIQALILTREVEKGGKMVNDEREKNGLEKLTLIFADMILADLVEGGDKNFSNKTSSTNIRQFLAQQK